MTADVATPAKTVTAAVITLTTHMVAGAVSCAAVTIAALTKVYKSMIVQGDYNRCNYNQTGFAAAAAMSPL